PTTYLYFEEAYQLCNHYKIADPRFVEPDVVEEVRNRINSNDRDWLVWRVPDEKWIKTFEEKINRPIYNSVPFPEGWRKEDTPANFVQRVFTEKPVEETEEK